MESGVVASEPERLGIDVDGLAAGRRGAHQQAVRQHARFA
jgi:hypothetical protein